MDEDFLIQNRYSPPLSAIKQIEFAASKTPGVISLAQGVPSAPSEKAIREAAMKAIETNRADKYSTVSGLIKLRRLIAEDLAKEEMNYRPEDEIIVTAGAIEALSSTILALIKPNDEVIIATPAYPNYQEIIKTAGAKAVELQLNEKNNWDFDLKQLKKKVSRKVKAIIICNPNNPTGSVIKNDKLIELAKFSQAHHIIIILDDVYYNLYYGKDHLENLCQKKEFKENIIRIVSFSKDFSLSGWRIGFLHGPKEKLNKILATHENLINCAPVVSQYAAIAALRYKEETLLKNLKLYQKNREIMGSYLENLNKFIQFSWPKGTYYFFPKIIGLKNATKAALDILTKVKLAVVPGDAFGLGGEGHIRLCFGRPTAKIREGMERLKYYFLHNVPTRIRTWIDGSGGHYSIH